MNTVVIHQQIGALILYHKSLKIKREREHQLRKNVLYFRLLQILRKKYQHLIYRRSPREWQFPRNSNLIENVLKWPDDIFARRFRMCKDTFFELVSDLTPQLEQHNKIRATISVQVQVAISIYVLKSNADFSIIADAYGVSTTSVHRIIGRFMNAVIKKYFKSNIKFPMSLEDQQVVFDDFKEKFGFGSIGAIDGTHVPILTPAENGADYFNYKHFHSIHCQAIVDSNYMFLDVYIGQPGKVADGGAFSSSTIGRNLFKIVQDPFYFIADDAYPISEKLLKPYSGYNLTASQKHFNYRLSRSRMVVENAFARLKGRWRILLKRLDWSVENVVRCITTCCILHNILEAKNEIFVPAWRTRVETNDPVFGHSNGTYDYPAPNLIRAKGAKKRDDICSNLPFQDFYDE